MHELTVIQHILEISDQTARENNISGIESIQLVIGDLQHLNEDILISGFEAAREDTLAEHAELQISRLPVNLQCNACHFTFEPVSGIFSCPACHQSNTSILQGLELYIETIKGN